MIHNHDIPVLTKSLTDTYFAHSTVAVIGEFRWISKEDLHLALRYLGAVSITNSVDNFTQIIVVGDRVSCEGLTVIERTYPHARVVTEYKLDDVLLEFTPAAERLSIIESLAQQAKRYVVK